MKLLISENDIKKRVKSLGKQINEDYDSIINQILSEEYPAGSGKNIGSYFKKVILPI